MSKLVRFGIDLAKNSFAVCGIDEHGEIVLKKTLARTRLLEFFANIPPALVAMEAGSGAHHWARRLTTLGHDARSELRYTSTRTDGKSRWAESLKASKSWNKAAVALANKHARIAWALIARHQDYSPA